MRRLLEVVRSTRAGGRVWLLPIRNEEVAAARIEEVSGGAWRTPKEKEVFALVLKRRTNLEITSEHYASLYTVKNHVSRILRKLGLKTRREIFCASLFAYSKRPAFCFWSSIAAFT